MKELLDSVWRTMDQKERNHKRRKAQPDASRAKKSQRTTAGKPKDRLVQDDGWADRQPSRWSSVAARVADADPMEASPGAARGAEVRNRILGKKRCSNIGSEHPTQSEPDYAGGD